MEEYEELDNTTGLVYRVSDVSHYIDFRGRRFRQRFYTGFDAHEGEIARWFVLTESNEAIEKGLDLVQKFNELVRYLRRHYGTFEYCSVRHRQGDKKRINLHVVYFGSYIPQQVIEDWWWKNYSSHRSKMGRVYNIQRQAWYLSKYLSSEDFERYTFSSRWVFPGWIGFSKFWKEEYYEYPSKVVLKYLANVGDEERRKNKYFDMYLSVKKAGGWHNLYLQLEQERKARQGRDSEKQKRGRSRPLTSDGGERQLELWERRN